MLFNVIISRISHSFQSIWLYKLLPSEEYYLGQPSRGSVLSSIDFYSERFCLRERPHFNFTRPTTVTDDIQADRSVYPEGTGVTWSTESHVSGSTSWPSKRPVWTTLKSWSRWLSRGWTGVHFLVASSVFRCVVTLALSILQDAAGRVVLCVGRIDHFDKTLKWDLVFFSAGRELLPL